MNLSTTQREPISRNHIASFVMRIDSEKQVADIESPFNHHMYSEVYQNNDYFLKGNSDD